MRLRITLFALVICSFSLMAKEYHVSTKGNDNNKGTIEKPFKTIEKARDAIRMLNTEERKQNIDIILHGGTYTLNKTIVFSLEDSAPDNFRYTYRAATDEEVILSSGLVIENWEKVVKYPDSFPEVAKGNVWIADMPEGLDNFKVLFDGTKRLKRARSEGFNGKNPFNVPRFASRNVKNREDRKYLKMFPFPDGEIKDWPNKDDVEIFFCPVPWVVNYSPIEKVDLENNIAYLKYEANSQPFVTPKEYNLAYVENVIDFLDEPGEWVLNTDERKIYYWPVKGEPGNEITAPALMEYIKVEGKINYDEAEDIPVRNLEFKGITFMHGDRYSWWEGHKGWGIQHDWDKFDNPNAMLRFRGAENCVVEECRFTASGNSAIRLDLYAQNIRVENNLIDYVGHMGILLAGYGPGTKDVNKKNIIVNNIIDHVGEVVWHGHAIFIWQSGENYVANNLIQNCPRKAVGICGIRAPIFYEGPQVDWDEASKTLRWDDIDPALLDPVNVTQEAILPYLHANDNLVENNEVFRSRTKIGDGSSLNVSGAGTGNVIRSNILLELMGNGMRTDDWQRETTFSDNIITSGGIVHKGHNHIENNLLVNSNIRFTTYPEQKPFPGSRTQRNVMYFTRGGGLPYTERVTPEIFTPDDVDLKNNLYYHSVNNEVVIKFLERVQGENGWDEGTISTDPLFENPIPQNRKLKPEDFKLKKESPAFELGYEEIDASNIGLRDDFPNRLKEKIFPSYTGNWISKDANIELSSTGEKNEAYNQILFQSEEEPDIAFAIKTKKEKNPFAIVDLGSDKSISGLTFISAGSDSNDAFKSLGIFYSSDKVSWTKLWENDPYHTKTGRIWDIIPHESINARYIRFSLKGEQILTLKNINIYGK